MFHFHIDRFTATEVVGWVADAGRNGSLRREPVEERHADRHGIARDGREESPANVILHRLHGQIDGKWLSRRRAGRVARAAGQLNRKFEIGRRRIARRSRRRRVRRALAETPHRAAVVVSGLSD